MKKIGIIAAMEEEIVSLKQIVIIKKIEFTAGISFYIGKWDETDVILARCGIGKVNAAMCAQILCSTYSCGYIINTGVAGGLDNRLNIGDIVVSSEVCQHDFDTTAFGDAPGFISRLNKLFFKADEELIRIALSAAKNLKSQLTIEIGRIASGDQFISGKERKEFIVSAFGASCVEMEGAAIGHVCEQNGVPFIVIRAISDKADESAQEDFPVFAKKAAVTSAALVAEMLKEIQNVYYG